MPGVPGRLLPTHSVGPLKGRKSTAEMTEGPSGHPGELTEQLPSMPPPGAVPAGPLAPRGSARPPAAPARPGPLPVVARGGPRAPASHKDAPCRDPGPCPGPRPPSRLLPGFSSAWSKENDAGPGGATGRERDTEKEEKKKKKTEGEEQEVPPLRPPFAPHWPGPRTRHAEPHQWRGAILRGGPGPSGEWAAGRRSPAAAPPPSRRCRCSHRRSRAAPRAPEPPQPPALPETLSLLGLVPRPPPLLLPHSRSPTLPLLHFLS